MIRWERCQMDVLGLQKEEPLQRRIPNLDCGPVCTRLACWKRGHSFGTAQLKSCICSWFISDYNLHLLITSYGKTLIPSSYAFSFTSVKFKLLCRGMRLPLDLVFLLLRPWKLENLNLAFMSDMHVRRYLSVSYLSMRFYMSVEVLLGI